MRLQRRETISMQPVTTTDTTTDAPALSAHRVPSGQTDVAVLGLGYVGLTLAASLAARGLTTLGYDRSRAVVQRVEACDASIGEHGVAKTLQDLPAGRLLAVSQLPAQLPDTLVICVGTPVDPETHVPTLSQLDAVLDDIGPRIGTDTVVILRSTVPVGTTEGRVCARLRQYVSEPHVAFAPERTIQGQALHELRTLPQIVGATDSVALARAEDLFKRLTSVIVPVSSPAAAELAKLVCNSHTDLLYGFGNEVARIAETVGLDATEVIAAANRHYPRPDLARPGFVGGSCLTKDPYLLLDSVKGGYQPRLVLAARELNEALPTHVAERVEELLTQNQARLSQSTILLAGVAYKGHPITDDIRGSAAISICSQLRGRVAQLLGHDYVVDPQRMRMSGIEPVDLQAGACQAHAMILLVEHPRYRCEDPAELVASLRPPRIVYDVWGVWRERLSASRPAVEYIYTQLGHG